MAREGRAEGGSARREKEEERPHHQGIINVTINIGNAVHLGQRALPACMSYQRQPLPCKPHGRLGAHVILQSPVYMYMLRPPPCPALTPAGLPAAGQAAGALPSEQRRASQRLAVLVGGGGGTGRGGRASGACLPTGGANVPGRQGRSMPCPSGSLAPACPRPVG